MPLPTPERIAKARLQAEQAKARLQALEARLSESERKKDTRRKIILGGLLLDAASKDDRYAKVVSALLARVVGDRLNAREARDHLVVLAFLGGRRRELDSLLASAARVETPGGSISPFWLPPTAASTPHSSMRKSTEPREEMVSTSKSAGWPVASSARSTSKRSPMRLAGSCPSGTRRSNCRAQGRSLACRVTIFHASAKPRSGGAAGEQSVRSQSDAKTKKWFADANLDIVDAVEKVARDKGLSMPLVATAWVLRQGCYPIVGLSSEKRVKETVEALKVTLTDDECKFLEAGYRPRNIEGM